MFTPYDAELEVTRRKAVAAKLANQYLPLEPTRQRFGFLRRLFGHGRPALPVESQPEPDRKPSVVPS